MTPKSPAEAPSADPIDLAFRAQVAQATTGLAPTAFAQAWVDWAWHLAMAPGRQQALQAEALKRAQDTLSFAAQAATGGQPMAPTEGLPEGEADRRFAHEAWNQFPFNVYARAFQNASAMMAEATRGVPGMSDYNARLLGFAARLVGDGSAPSNFLASNPELLAQTQAEQGANLARGWQNWLEDLSRTLDGGMPAGAEQYVVGRDVAATPGKVVFRNRLVELIQYAPSTPDVHAEPVFIVPAWIMKYYILDLSPKNSMVKYLVDQGHTVFMMSWKNPGPEDQDLGMDDYLNLGLRAALDAASRIVPDQRLHAVGYCIGGTLLAIGAAALAREKDERIASVTMFAAQTDFSEPGELAFFINPAQLSMLEASMQQKGVLESQQMGGAFALLRAKDLVFQPIIDQYIKGKRDSMIDLMAWNADGTRMPARMHTEYLYRLYLENALAKNRFEVNGQRVRLSDIRVPMFVVGTESDHVAPWPSVYKIDNLVRSDDFSFLLTASGHNAGIVCGPVHPKRHYRLRTRGLADPHLAPEDWMADTPKQPGAWWPAWQQWLAAHSSGRVKARSVGGGRRGGAELLGDAPGEYVLQR